MGVVERPVGATEPAVLLGLTGVGLDHTHAGDVLLEGRQIVADPFPHGEIGLVRLALEPDRRQRDERQHQQRQQGQLPRHDQQHDDRERDEQRRRHELQQAPLHEFAHRLDVGRHARHQHARLVAVEEPHRLTLDLVEQPQPQGPQEPLAGPVDVDVLLAAPDVRHDRRHHVQPDRDVQRACVVSPNSVIDAVAQQQRSDHGRTGGHGDEPERQERRPAKRARQPGRAAQHLLGLIAIEAVLLADGVSCPHVSRLPRRSPQAPGPQPTLLDSGCSSPAVRRACPTPRPCRHRSRPHGRPSRSCRGDGRSRSWCVRP